MRIDALPEVDPARAEREPGPRTGGLPVRWSTEESLDESSAGGGAGNVVSAQGGEELNAQEARPDAMGQGWVTPPGGDRVDALFVLAGASLGIGRTERIAAPVWLALSDLVSLDAIGEPTDGLTEVEIGMADGTVIGAGWTDDFVAAVVDALRAGAESRSEDAAAAGPSDSDSDSETDAADTAAPHESLAPDGAAPAIEDTPATGSPDVRFDEIGVGERYGDPVAPFGEDQPLAEDQPFAENPPFSAQPVVRNRSRRAESNGTSAEDVTNEPETAPAPAAAPADVDAAPPSAAVPGSMFGVGPVDPPPAADSIAAPLAAPVDRSGALELEDVVYLGGYPGQTRRRKKCTAVLTHGGLEVAGPGDLRFRIAWDVVKTIETQNSDEARFRMNTKIHGDSSALVVECDQGVTILLEARDCPTIPLRSAIAQLLSDLPVLVV